jgi:hypothetical protein
VDPFASMRFPGVDGLTIYQLKSTLPHHRATVVLVNSIGVRVGFIARHPAGCDVVSLAPDMRAQGLSAEFVLAARALRARTKHAEISDLRLASTELFCGGSYSVAGLACVRAAHRAAIAKALRHGKPVPDNVLRDYRQSGSREAGAVA